MLAHHPHAPIYWLITQLSGVWVQLHSDSSEQIWFELWRPCGLDVTELTRVWCLYYVVMGDFQSPAHCRTPTVETVSLVSFSRPTVDHGRRCIYFLWEVKGSEGGEEWRGSLKVRAGFLRCSGGHPATSPGSVYIYRSLIWYRRKTEKRGETGSQTRRQGETKHCFKGMRRE